MYSDRQWLARTCTVELIVVLGRALSDPIRVRMLGMLAAEAAEGRGRCDLPRLEVFKAVRDEILARIEGELVLAASLNR